MRPSCKFIEAVNKSPVYVFADMVRLVGAGQTDDSAQIVFAYDHTVYVEGRPSDVTKQLEASG